jgi:hypothetical protein
MYVTTHVVYLLPVALQEEEEEEDIPDNVWLCSLFAGVSFRILWFPAENNGVLQQMNFVGIFFLCLLLLGDVLTPPPPPPAFR